MQNEVSHMSSYCEHAADDLERPRGAPARLHELLFVHRFKDHTSLPRSCCK